MDLFPFDDDYVRRLKLGDRWTEEHFTGYFQQLLLIKLRSRVRSVDDIDDIRQEVFRRVFAAIRSEAGLRDGRALGAFVNTTCNYVLLERHRGDGRTEPLDERKHDLPAGDADAFQLLATEETKAVVRRILDGLEPRERDILRAIFIDERDKDQVCAEFGVDRSYLRVLLHRAKEKFRTAYRAGRALAFPK